MCGGAVGKVVKKSKRLIGLGKKSNSAPAVDPEVQAEQEAQIAANMLLANRRRRMRASSLSTRSVLGAASGRGAPAGSGSSVSAGSVLGSGGFGGGGGGGARGALVSQV